MRQPASVLLTVVVVLGAAASVATVGGAQSIGVSVAVEGEPVEDGDEVTLASDPTLRLDVSAGTALETVVVRVEDTTVATFTPEGSSLSEELLADLATGTNEVTVIAKDADGTVEELSVSILKDNRRPVVQFSRPFVTDGGDPPETTNVSGSRVRIAGRIIEHTAVERIEITRTNSYEFAQAERVSRKTYRLEPQAEGFRQVVFLGNESNTVSILLEDRMGNQRTYEFELVVNDTEPPEIELEDLPETTQAPFVELDGEARDNGQLDAVTLSVSGRLKEASLLGSAGPKPDEERVAFRLDREVELRPGENRITVAAIDLFGHRTEKEYVVTYEKTVAPAILLDRDLTGFAGTDVTVHGAVKYGEIRSVAVETVSPATGETIDIVQVYDGAVTTSVPVSETLATGDGVTRVVVRAVDRTGAETKREFLVDPGRKATFVTPTPTPVAGSGGGGGQTGNGSTGNGGSGNATATATPGSSGGSAGGQSGEGSDDGIVDVLTSLPGFGVGPALVAVLLLALLAARRR